MSAEQFDRWAAYNRIRPINDQANHHFPIAQLEATLININRGQNTRAVSFKDRLLFGREEPDIEDVLASENW